MWYFLYIYAVNAGEAWEHWSRRYSGWQWTFNPSCDLDDYSAIPNCRYFLSGIMIYLNIHKTIEPSLISVLHAVRVFYRSSHTKIKDYCHVCIKIKFNVYFWNFEQLSCFLNGGNSWHPNTSINYLYSFFILGHPFGTNKDNLFNSESFLGLAIILLFLVILTLSLPQVTKIEFLLTISIQYQAGRWWE